MNDIRNILKCYFVAGSQDCDRPSANRADNLLSVLEQALQGGITCFQFRDKGKNSLADFPEQQRALAAQCRELCRRYGVPFFVDDDLDLAVALNADGIHVGQEDISPAEIKRKISKPMIIGLSAHNLQQLSQAQAEGVADYCGLGPVFPTLSKEKHQAPTGMECIGEARKAGITIPVVMIGGIKQEHIKPLIAQGADGVAVISAITQADDAKQAAAALKQAACIS
ncbi:thiamine phosphate synthase [Neisseria animalis]|uniref:Thiamine-phosphate synthase n=1 Tax=Neisseria animalis TaxID=492 RepID=A0A5P3MP84_NEIAN|nr:thiamine phosphate synthase [Neisseria animalis]QEY23344.1 thiamine phosphate synthase [Neisseria animalis]ROW33192.1 thiamine phosphate synthase [Neisseria animalis]VEE08728.1 thiamin-phosphate pyrophosphorylase [Neisseria animalis]